MLKNHRFFLVQLLYLLVSSIIIILLGLFPFIGFDDVFMTKNGLLPYIDFRPGYPPIGKLPYYLFYNLLQQKSVYSFCVLFFNLTTLSVLSYTLYSCIKKLGSKRAFKLAFIVIIMPSVIYLTVVYSRADALAMTFALCALYFIDNPWMSGAFCGIGALTKFYPAFLLIPLVIYYKGIKKKISLIYSFILIVLILSIPFLLSDPLMYVSVVTSHTLRGPAESIFSVIDGYYGHTGFLHPTFDATIYSWQFAAVYNQSSSDHFMYLWKNPFLPYISTGLQMAFMIIIGWMARNKQDQKESIMLISLAMFSYFVFSTFYNPIIHLAQIPFLILATLDWSRRSQIGIIVAFEIANIIHSLVWFSPVFLFMGRQLPLSLAIVFRVVLYAIVFINFARRRTI